ncbi:hypothetical protein HK096_001586 [Nowakowskiella sp. JEL0078]|nr:hypothetical protein HK096_001586 [Nowakowskiella sp. JEL0078]
MVAPALFVCLILLACQAAVQAKPRVVIVGGADLPAEVGPRFAALLAPLADSLDIYSSANFTLSPSIDDLSSEYVVFDLNDPESPYSDVVEDGSELPDDSFSIKAKFTDGGAFFVHIKGSLPPAYPPGPRPSSPVYVPVPEESTFQYGNRGLAYGIYAALEELGFAFLHPLAPATPPELVIPASTGSELVLDIQSSPKWPWRAIHIHTQHPLELTPFFQGWYTHETTTFESTPSNASEVDTFPYILENEYPLFLEWLLANRQNAFEVFLLETKAWLSFSRSEERHNRLKQYVKKAQDFGIWIGLDVPILFEQQHAFRLLPDLQIDEELNLIQIRNSIDWVMGAGWDFLGTESGSSEFTSVPAAEMLQYLDETASYLASTYPFTRLWIKVHCSTGQIAEGYIDPRNPEHGINFNFLPHYANDNVGLLVHTVEPYALEGPAFTYGNKNFSYLKDFMNYEIVESKKSVVFYPETAYWVSVDIDVPLFLPTYAERRLYDLELVIKDQEQSTNELDGQLIFSSGWEWGYWLNDVISARAAWDPLYDPTSPPSNNALPALRKSLGPLAKHFSADLAEKFENLIADWAEAELALVLNGTVDGINPPADIASFSTGLGYLEGWDTWDDISKVVQESKFVKGATMTQPDRIGLIPLRFSSEKQQQYRAHIAPLLRAMSTTFDELVQRTEKLLDDVPTYLKPLVEDIVDAGRMTYLRAKLVDDVFAYVETQTHFCPGCTSKPKLLLLAVNDTLAAAHAVVQNREQQYRVPAYRVAFWSEKNPTAYQFGYLWSVHSLHYWWRDVQRALLHVLVCNMNIINPLKLALGTGELLDTADFIERYSKFIPGLRDCLSLVGHEPDYPRDLVGLKKKFKMFFGKVQGVKWWVWLVVLLVVVAIVGAIVWFVEEVFKVLNHVWRWITGLFSSYQPIPDAEEQT